MAKFRKKQAVFEQVASKKDDWITKKNEKKIAIFKWRNGENFAISKKARYRLRLAKRNLNSDTQFHKFCLIFYYFRTKTEGRQRGLGLVEANRLK